MDAIELLKRDHQEVEKLFQRFSSGADGRGRMQVVEKICQELEVHTQIEEEIFYPAVRETGDENLGRKVAEALQEHQQAKEKIQTLRGMSDDDQGELESTVSSLQQDIEHHVTEEEGEMFPRVAQIMDDERREEIGEQLAERKEDLTGRAGRSASGQAATGRRGARTAGRARARSRRGKTARGGRGRTATKSAGRGRASSARARTSTGRGRATTARGRATSARGSAAGSRAKGTQRMRSRAATKRKSTARKARGRRTSGRKQARGGRRR
jgi:hemerythrin superfamily protein